MFDWTELQIPLETYDGIFIENSHREVFETAMLCMPNLFGNNGIKLKNFKMDKY